MDFANASIWIAGLSLGVLALSAALAWTLWRSRRTAVGLPSQWSLAARPVFSADERRTFRLLREALPHHVVLSKLPLVRFCQPTEAKEVRYWYDLLGSAHVTFAVCSPNGRVLAAIDLDGERGVTPRSLEIKRAVLDACRVRYLRVSADHPPSIAELQLLVPRGGQARGPQPSTGASGGRRSREDDGSSSDWGQFSQPLPLWQETSAFRDLGQPLGDPAQEWLHRPRHTAMAVGGGEDPDEIVGVVVDAPPPRYAGARQRH